MRRSFLLVVLIFWMTGCIGASAPGGRVCREGLCIMIAVPEPVRFGEPIVVKITVTGDQDIKNLGVSIYHDVDAAVDISRDAETGTKEIIVFKGGVAWMTDIRAGEERTFVGNVVLPMKEGLYQITVDAVKPDSTRVGDHIEIHYTPEDSTVYLSGTKIPMTPGPELGETTDPRLLQTLRAMPTETPYPTLTAVPTTQEPFRDVLGTPAYPPPPGTPYP